MAASPAIMPSNLRNTGVAAVVLLLSLYVWRAAYPLSDWALLALGPLAVLLFLGHLGPGLELHQARMRAAIRPESPLLGILTGRIKATLNAGLFVLIAVPLLAWQGLAPNPVQAAIFIVLCLVAGAVFGGVQSELLVHCHRPYVRTSAVSISTWLVALAFVPVIAWVNLNLVHYPGEIRAADSLSDAALRGMQVLPVRRGWIAEVFAPLYAYEAGKLWLVVQMSPSRWLAILFSLDSALFSFILARTSVILTAFVQSLDGRNGR
jgi:hypothetical protein